MFPTPSMHAPFIVGRPYGRCAGHPGSPSSIFIPTEQHDGPLREVRGTTHELLRRFHCFSFKSTTGTASQGQPPPISIECFPDWAEALVARGNRWKKRTQGSDNNLSCPLIVFLPSERRQRKRPPIAAICAGNNTFARKPRKNRPRALPSGT